MKILMVLTSHDKLGNKGRKTGFWLEEFAAPYYHFKDAGAEIVLASPKGGQPPLDPKSNEPDFQTELTHRFEADAAAKAQLAATVRLDSVSQADFDTVFYPGGTGLPCAGRAAARGHAGRQAAGAGQESHRLHQHRRSRRGTDEGGAVPCGR